MIKERYLVPSEGKDEDALKKALQVAVHMAEKYDSQLTLVVPALKHAEGTLLKYIVSEAQLKKLVNGETLLIGNNVKLTIASTATFHKTTSKVLVALFASKKMLLKLEKSNYCEVLVVLPWAGSADTDEWQSKWSPVVLTSGS